ncbi:hypothetical protein [Asticcacaulis sp. EMRT-3]|uniref:hypothetical protein n=1 Tax=Asticcacaulis sp. EMRT-3 TaxID=3040349 RepID=UPI0024AFBBC2|nr:hypothetical protein [Asticcacaulis sp. EMRT-3]MDI7774715.1 hypothetical protein [Asticcacaulis sp. EMRT-3]
MTPPVSDDDKQAYLKAQKQRNLFIGLALAVFVILVFFISMSRMAQGLRNDAHRSAASASAAPEE